MAAHPTAATAPAAPNVPPPASTATAAAPPTAQAPAAPRIALGKSILSSSISIKQNAATAASATIPVIQANVEPLTQQRLEALWAEVGEALGIKDLLAQATVELEERNNFTIIAQTTIFDHDFKPHKTNVMQWLREKTGLRMIEATVKVRYVEKDALPYSPDDKYQYMLKKNPAMAELRKLFPQLDY